jgi:hypothetical protein
MNKQRLIRERSADAAALWIGKREAPSGAAACTGSLSARTVDGRVQVYSITVM